MPRIKAIAFYLPQFHPIPENDKWWGKGFTEWTNTAKAKPLFRGHYQPNIPADLGFYDLRLADVREAQAAMAKEYGIYAFCYWHYWFGNGRTVLEKPFKEVLKTKKPDFPFCLAWANESWTGIWHGLANETIIKQTYPGEKDIENHFYSILEAFHDHRYIKIDNQPLFIIYKPELLPNPNEFTSLWNELAVKEGFNGIYFVGIFSQVDINHKSLGFNSKTFHVPWFYINNYKKGLSEKIKERFLVSFRLKDLKLYDYKKIINSFKFSDYANEDYIPTVLPNWDNTPRSVTRGLILYNSTPALFGKQLKSAVEFVLSKNENERFLFIKSWNEWAEGNYLEPDLQWGTAYLKKTSEVLDFFSK